MSNITESKVAFLNVKISIGITNTEVVILIIWWLLFIIIVLIGLVNDQKNYINRLIMKAVNVGVCMCVCVFESVCFLFQKRTG